MKTPGVSLLLGAGASVEAGIPAVGKFFTCFASHVRANLAPELADALGELQGAWRVATKGGELADLERLYELLTSLNNEGETASLPFALPGFTERSRAIELLTWELKKYVQARCLRVPPRRLGYLRPLASFTRFGQPLFIATLNYDACIETTLDGMGVNWTDGGPPDGREFHGANLNFPADSAVHLVKLHGSVTWYHTRLDSEPGFMRRVLGAHAQAGVSRAFRAARSMTHEAMMVYPTLHKALAHGPFPRLMTRAREGIAQSHLCIAIGYSFGDAHVRRLVLEALELNSELRLVVLTPDADKVLRKLYENCDQFLHDRMGVASLDPTQGYAGRALADGWLLARTQEWLRGAPLPNPLTPDKGRRGGLETPIPSPNRWTLRYPVSGGVSGLARMDDTLLLARRIREEILVLSLTTGQSRTLTTGIASLHGLAFDTASNTVYAVSNKHRPPWSRGGIGQLWAVDGATGAKRALTRVRTLPSFLRLLTLVWRGENWQRPYWKLLVGALNWPTSVMVERPGETLLFTEARSLRRFDLKSGRVKTAIELPLPFNVVDLALERPGLVLVADAGVHPGGMGRLLRCNLESGDVAEVATGWRRVGAMTYIPHRRSAVVSLGESWPRGSIVEVDLDDPPRVRRTWKGLANPTHFAESPDREYALVATREGVVQLDFG